MLLQQSGLGQSATVCNCNTFAKDVSCSSLSQPSQRLHGDAFNLSGGGLQKQECHHNAGTVSC